MPSLFRKCIHFPEKSAGQCSRELSSAILGKSLMILGSCACESVQYKVDGEQKNSAIATVQYVVSFMEQLLQLGAVWVELTCLSIKAGNCSRLIHFQKILTVFSVRDVGLLFLQTTSPIKKNISDSRHRR